MYKSINTRSVSLQDREEIRRRLAFESDGDESSKSSKSTISDPYQNIPDPWRSLIAKQALLPSHHSCFFDDNIDDTVIDEEEQAEDDQVCDNNDGKKEERLRINRKKKLVEYCHKLNQSKSFPKVQELSTIQSILAKHFEKRKLLHHFFNLSSSRRIAKLRLNLITLKSMSIPKLQILVNDFHTQIEILNDHLVRLLLERDDLHMEQDSLLMDIQDETMFLMKKMNKQAISEPNDENANRAENKSSD